MRKYHRLGIPTRKRWSTEVHLVGPGPTVTVASVDDNGAPVELVQIDSGLKDVGREKT